MARAGYAVALVAALAWLVGRRRGELADLVEGARPALLLAALALSFGQLVLNAMFWRTALAFLGDERGLTTVLSASTRSLLARYVPGSVWYQLGRSALLHRQGVSRRALGVVAVLDTGLGVVVAAAAGVALLLGAGRLPGGGPWLAAWCLGLAAACSPPVVNAVLAAVARRRGGEAQRIAWTQFLALLGVMALFWANSALMFNLYLRAFPGLELPSVVETTGTYLVSWVIGFLAVFAPQGAGVFETAVAGLLTDERTAGVAIVVAGFRALVLVRDVLAFGVSRALALRSDASATGPASGRVM